MYENTSEELIDFLFLLYELMFLIIGIQDKMEFILCEPNDWYNGL